MPWVVNLLATLRVAKPKSTRLYSVIALSTGKLVESLGFVGASSLLTRRREPRHPLRFSRSTIACTGHWE